MSRALLLAITALFVAGCGFQLRSALTLPPEMSRTYIDTADRHSLFYRTLRGELTANGIEVVESPIDATAIFNILADDTGQRVLSVSARNVPREYEVYYRIYYSVQTDGKMLRSPQEQTLTQDYTYDETLVLGKAREEDLLRETIARDLARLILMQLSTL